MRCGNGAVPRCLFERPQGASLQRGPLTLRSAREARRAVIARGRGAAQLSPTTLR